MALMEALMALMALMVDSSTFIPIKTFLFSASQNLSSKMLVFNVRKDQELYPPLAAFGFPKLSKMRVQYSFRSQKRKNVNKNPDSQRPQHPAPSKNPAFGNCSTHTYILSCRPSHHIHISFDASFVEETTSRDVDLNCIHVNRSHRYFR